MPQNSLPLLCALLLAVGVAGSAGPTSAQDDRFVDDGDGTVTDNQTGLQWEKKIGDEHCASCENVHSPDELGPGCVHCFNASYSWSNPAGALQPDGTVFRDFLGTLNKCTILADGSADAEGFAGHCDWRLPTLTELETIVDLAASGCLTSKEGPCINLIFGPAVPNFYWSSTQVSGRILLDAAGVDFSDGARTSTAKGNDFFVRAVRTADTLAPCIPPRRLPRLPGAS